MSVLPFASVLVIVLVLDCRLFSREEDGDDALFEILPQGAYTAILSGVGGTSGNGLVEAYNTD